MQTIEGDVLIEYCNHCGEDVPRGSGKFVNRIPDFNDILTRIDNQLKFPLRDFVCEECDLCQTEYEDDSN